MTLRNLQNEANNIRMTAAEKAMLKSQLFGVPAYMPVKSFYTIFNFQFVSRAVAVLLILSLGGGGVAYAAEGSLPGQPLYPVKINVDEPVQVALAPTTAAKATVYAQLAQTRIEEAEALAQQGALDATATQELSQNFSSQVQSADALALQVANQDPAAAADIQTSLSASLEANSAVLAQVGNDSGTTTKEDSETLAAQVLATAVSVGGSAPADISAASASTTAVVAIHTAPAESTPAGQESSGVAVNVQALATIAPTPASPASTSVDVTQTEATSTTPTATSSAAVPARGSSETGTRATQALMSAQQSYDAAKPSLDATTTAALDAQFAQASVFLQNGEYTQALRLAVKLQTLIEAGQNLHTNILPLLKLDTNTGVPGSGKVIR